MNKVFTFIGDFCQVALVAIGIVFVVEVVAVVILLGTIYGQ